MSLGASKYNIASYGCCEWANNARTLAYHQWACAENLYPENCVPELLNLCQCDADAPDVPFVDPATDNAPWYDPAVAESVEFLGIIILGVSGIDASTFSREVQDGFSVGSILQRPTLKGKSFGFNVLLLATSCEGMAYGEEWFRSVLEDTGCRSERNCDSCGGKELSLRKHCPQGDTTDDGLRSWLSTGIVDGLTPVDSQNARACCCIIKNFTFTMASESPYAFNCGVVECEQVATGDEEQAFVRCYDWVNDCLECTEDCCDKCGFDNLCTCFPPVPVEPVLEDDCYCEPVAKIVQCCCVDDLPGAYDSTLKIDIFSGTDFSNDTYELNGLRNFNLKIYDNPRGYDCITDEESYNDWCLRAEPCAHLRVNYVPSNSTLSIDGRTGKITLNCLGKCRPFQHVVSSPQGSIFPLVAKCHPLMICAEWDYYNTQIIPEATGIIPAKMTATRYLRFRN